MSKDRIIELLQDLVKQLQLENAEQKDLIKQLLARINELLDRIASLEASLVQKSEEGEKEKRIKKALSKLNKNESEKTDSDQS